MRIAVTGGRNYNNKKIMNEALDYVLNTYPDFILIVGCARGADKLARQWAEDHKFPIERKEVYYAEWDKYPKAAGAIRNKRMLDSGIDILLAFPGGNGTENMKKICRDKNIYVIEIDKKE